MKKIIILSVFFLSACAGGPAPNYIGGKYFMAGDSDCTKVRLNNYGQLMCFNSNGELTGIRNEMSEMQVRNWNQKQAENSAAWADLGKSLSNIGKNNNNKSITCYSHGAVTTCN